MIEAKFRKCEFCIDCVNVSLTSATELKAIPFCVNKKGKVRVKVHLSQSDDPEVTQVTRMFYTGRPQTVPSDLVGCTAPNCVFFRVHVFLVCFACVNLIS